MEYKLIENELKKSFNGDVEFYVIDGDRFQAINLNIHDDKATLIKKLELLIDGLLSDDLIK